MSFFVHFSFGLIMTSSNSFKTFETTNLHFFFPETEIVYFFVLFLFLTEEIQYHDGLRSRELGQAPILLCGPNS